MEIVFPHIIDYTQLGASARKIEQMTVYIFFRRMHEKIEYFGFGNNNCGWVFYIVSSWNSNRYALNPTLNQL